MLCYGCKFLDEGKTTSFLCTHPSFRGGPEPLFFAVLKCGTPRKFYEPLNPEPLPVEVKVTRVKD